MSSRPDFQPLAPLDPANARAAAVSPAKDHATGPGRSSSDRAPRERRSLATDSPPRLRTNLILFVLTVYTVFLAGANMATLGADRSFLADLVDPAFLARGASFAIPLLAILGTHEFGHFFAARWHRVPASFPYFIPSPFLPGTFGAVISMRDTIRSRNALLDIGASGPLAGLVVALPVVAWGLAHSEVLENPATGYTLEGQSLLYSLLKRAAVGPIPEGYDVWLHPTAFAGWFGLLLTMINLLPWGQLDGGHIGYALFGERQHAIARWFRYSLLGLFGYNIISSGLPVLLGTSERSVDLVIASSSFWLLWFFVLGLLSRVSGGAEHPPCEPGELTPARRVVAWLCLAIFLLLFMPTPIAYY